MSCNMDNVIYMFPLWVALFELGKRAYQVKKQHFIILDDILTWTRLALVRACTNRHTYTPLRGIETSVSRWCFVVRSSGCERNEQIASSLGAQRVHIQIYCCNKQTSNCNERSFVANTNTFIFFYLLLLSLHSQNVTMQLDTVYLENWLIWKGEAEFHLFSFKAVVSRFHRGQINNALIVWTYF